MTTFSKCLAVLAAIGSLALLGVVSVMLVGGPNWLAEAEKTPDYAYTLIDGEPPTWSVARRRDDAPVSVTRPTMLPSALVAVHRQIQSEQRAEIDRLTSEIERMRGRIKEAEELIAIDLKAIDARVKQLEAEMADLQQQILDKGDEAIQLAQQAQTKRAQAQELRDDALRIRSQLAEIRTDRYQAQEQYKRLNDLVIRIESNIERLQRRQQQLLDQGADPNKAYNSESVPATAGAE